MAGGDGADVIVIRAGPGTDTITGFDAGDRLLVSADVTGGAIANLRDPAVHLEVRDGSAWIEFGGGNALHLAGLSADDLARLVDHQATIL